MAPTPVFLPGESQGWRSLVGCRLWGRTESDTTEATQQQQQQGILVHPQSLLKPGHRYVILALSTPARYGGWGHSQYTVQSPFSPGLPGAQRPRNELFCHLFSHHRGPRNENLKPPEQCCPTELPSFMEMFYLCAARYCQACEMWLEQPRN